MIQEKTLVGVAVKRLEDHELLIGAGQFVDDISFPGMLHAAFVRSPHAHAEIRAIDCAAARELEGVVAVYTIDDLAPFMTTRRVPPNFPDPGGYDEIGPWVLADGEVCYAGEPVVVAVAEHRCVAEDAAMLVEVDYAPLPAVSDCRAGLEDGAPEVDTRAAGNLFAEYTIQYGDADAACQDVAHLVKDRLFQHRGCSVAMECRGLVARSDPADGTLTVWNSTQAPHSDKSVLVHLLDCDDNAVRVITPDLGGAFGPKLPFYPDDAAVCVVATMLRRPVKWIEDRRENLMTTTQERDQEWQVEMAVDGDGRILALRGHLYHDQGAYTARGANIPYSSATTILGPYVVPNYRMNVHVGNTNKVPATSYRGAGHPQGCFTMERLLDWVAQATGIERAEIRRRNMIQADQMPYTHPLRTQANQPLIYDSGDYPACQAAAIEALDYGGFAARREAAREAGRYLGIAIANYVKPTGRGPYEMALVRVGTSGKVSVYTGAVAMGQGFRTAMSQICADQLGVAMDDVIMVSGDTVGVPRGFGGFASRQTVTAGSSIHLAAAEVRDKALRIAAHMLEADEHDIELSGGRARVRGVPDMSVTLGKLAHAVVGTPGYPLPPGITPGLEATAAFTPENMVYANGCHGVEVEVDPGTGGVTILRYVVVHDSGRLINPLIVDGQVQGGVAQGIGNALFEWMQYDAACQPVTTNLAEYLLPTAAEVPHMEIIHQESPTPRNPIGVKGVGECGVMAAAPAVISAVENALQPFGVRITRAPVSPAMLVDLIGNP